MGTASGVHPIPLTRVTAGLVFREYESSLRAACYAPADGWTGFTGTTIHHYELGTAPRLTAGQD